MSRDIKIRNVSRKKSPGVSLAGIPEGGSSYASNEGVFVSTEFFRNDIVGKPYPGRINYITQRTLAYNSTVVRAIISLRTQQIAMLPYDIVPSNDDEPTKKISIFDYNHYELTEHPAFDKAEKEFLKKIYLRLDPDAYKINKQALFEGAKEEGEFTGAELATLTYLQEKHDEFYEERDRDIAEIKALLNNPDPWYTDTRSWSQLVQMVLFDLIALDRGALFKIRDENGVLRGLMPTDGPSYRPLINEFGFYDLDKAYVQVSEKSGLPHSYISKDDLIIMSMHKVSDMRYFGYGMSPMETLFTAVLADIYIDKGQLDFYRKGGSIPEGFLAIEPPTSRDGMISHMDQEQIEYMQRHLQALMAGDYTQVPIFSGGKVTYTDFKGKRRDMQYKELAEYMTRKICSVLQVSPQDVGIITDTNRATADTMQQLTRSKGLLPLMSTISEYMTNEVVLELRPQGDLKHVITEKDAEQEKDKWTITQQQLISGVITINEYRVAHGKSPVPWGNTPLQGLRNWKDEEEDGGGGMLGDIPGLPGGGGMPPLPSMNNPGGPVGGENPGAGRPPIDAMKAARFFSLKSAASEEEAEELMVKGFTEIYNESSNFREMLALHDIHNYPGGEWLRTPIDSYKHFVKKNEHLAIKLDVPDEVDKRDVILLSSFDRGNIKVGEGRLPLIKALAGSVSGSLDRETFAEISEITRGNPEEGIERYIYSQLDQPLQDALYQDFYKYKSFAVTDAQVEEIEKVFNV